MTLQPGSRFGPYAIISRLGAGGMGEVFRARDTKLNRDVALKVLPQDSPAGMERLRRFEQEARAASQLNHPNIVTIYDIGIIDDVTYIVMELVEGRNLRDLTADHDPPLKEVARIGVKVAEGLAAAHDRGIIHRDLKPENVMVTADGFVKILDFGLAKLTAPIGDKDATLPHSTPGAVLGTVNYMSPEQAGAGPSDFRCDQFSLGVILYELIARKRPFDRPSAVETMAAIIRDEAPPLSAIPDVPPRFPQIIERCLSKNPRDRYASTRDLARDLREVRDELSSAARSGPRSAPPGVRVPIPPRRRAIIGTSIGAALVIAAAAGWLLMHRGARAVPAGRHVLYLAPLRSQAAGRDGEVFADGLTDAIGARLAKSPDLRVIRVADDGAVPKNVLDAARHRRADLVLQGVVLRTADQVRVSYSLLDAKTSSPLGGDSVTGPGDDLFALPDLVADGVLRTAGAPSLGQRSAVAGLARPQDQQSYLIALGLLHRMKDEKAVDEAIRRLEALLLNARDSAPINGALGKALLRKYASSKQTPLIEQASVYAARAAEIDPSLPDVHVTLGDLKKAGGHFDAAAAEYQIALAQRPDYPDAILGLAETYEYAGRGAEAEREYRRVLALAPDWPSVYAKYGRYCLKHNEVEKAADLFRQMTQVMPESPRGYANLGGALTMLGRYEEALQAYRRSAAIEPSAVNYSNLGACQYYLGQYTDAAATMERAVQMSPDHYIFWMNLGDARRWADKWLRPEAIDAYNHAIERARAVVKVNPKDAVARAITASALAKLGRTAEAAKDIDLALKADPTDPEVLFEAAVVSLRRHDREGAAAWLRRAVSAGYSASQAARDPELAELH